MPQFNISTKIALKKIPQRDVDRDSDYCKVRCGDRNYLLFDGQFALADFGCDLRTIETGDRK